MTQKSLAELRKIVNQAYLADEKSLVSELLYCVWARFALFRKPSPRPFNERRGGQQLHFAPLMNISAINGYDPAAISQTATTLAVAVREKRHRQSAIEAFLHEYQLTSREGIILMSIAEALLRIPDSRTQDLLLQEKLSGVDWQSHLHHSDSQLVNLATRALLFAGDFEAHHDSQGFEQLLSRVGAPLIRAAVKQAMQHLALQFVFAESIQEAIRRSEQEPVFRYSFDMLGEAALTKADAERYFEAYRFAIDALAGHAVSAELYDNPGLSIKLSALYPRYEPLQHVRAVKALRDKLLVLARAARQANIMLTVDAEESERLDMSLDIFASAFKHRDLDGWPGLGLAVQAYQKRALPVIRWLAKLASHHRRKIPLRLVKGAYWDSEIKRAQEYGLADYPVFTRKSATDVSYLACAQVMLSEPAAFYPQFASHNAHTVAAIYHLGRQHPGYEFQRLHGMGESLYREIIDVQDWKIHCRVYAPIGAYHELLPYLVRRLLENGANTSFINQISRMNISVDELVSDPVAAVRASANQAQIVLPRNLFGDRRVNSSGLNLADPEQLASLQHSVNTLSDKYWTAMPLINGRPYSGKERLIVNPFDNRLKVGSVTFAEPEAIGEALTEASLAFADWRLAPVAKRAQYLLKAADLLEANRLELVSLCVREGGRTIKDALAEVREAVDFCRYYAQSAMDLFSQPVKLPGPTGEENWLYHYGRGVYVCISPWNFPIAIFIGQIAAALAAGNTVIAKPASQTALTAMRCVQLLHQAGVPESVLHFLPIGGNLFGEHLLADARVAGLVFTGSTETAQTINRQLALQRRDIVPVIAETGGQNVLIADSSALLEQLVQDAAVSAFNSVGQRCSALRVLFVQEEIADKTVAMLIGAMQELVIGNPGFYWTDIGPVIDRAALAPLIAHLEAMQQQGRLLYQLPVPERLGYGSFFPPSLIELHSLSQLTGEVFGPILHVIRYREPELDQVIDAVNATGYGLTLGIHSRIDSTFNTIRQRVKVGNIYVNRNMIGAVVGVQPFGGTGLSGTGPKAGGPDYLRRFVIEQTVTVNTAAIGGNATLLAQDLR
ncbi:bifunctional proline dehydrogenase/L-glutamate gamma-semialdehyde dehydrogenase PutA [Candidatus Methylobacter oryzae]|nr:bifunctional proline dehydrogenase/L-glutamate gamma-semialdehyde dehydrogenase PutA [Candidatus Methylobacter oryzae]